MIKNRFLKSTIGVGGEFVIATTIDNSSTPSPGAAPSSATITVTLAGTPTAGDRLNITVSGQHYDYVVQAGDTTAALLNASILAVLKANTQGFTATATGSTSSVFTLAAPIGTSFNGVVVTAAAGTPNAGPTFSSISTANFGTGGANPVTGGPAATLKDFQTNAAAGALGVYWYDTKTAVTPSSTGLYANKNRKFFYAFKTQDSNTLLTTPITCNDREYRTLPYNAGAVDTWTLLLGGTVVAGQIIHVRLMETTTQQIPYPTYEYRAVSTGTIATDLTAIRDAINAENQEPIATASFSGSTLTVTGKYNNRTFELQYFLETISNGAANSNIDSVTYTITHTVDAVQEVGTTADVKEFEKYFKIQNGIMIYVSSDNGLMTPDEFNSSVGQTTSNVVAGTQYGYLVVTHRKTAIFPGAPLPHNQNKVYTIVAITSTLLNQLAGY